ncbi:MAG TPA: DUF3570 domain-containing protein [Polyangiaceae bacterium]|nr:DUF3570 domain-containing protein [Polyangiaceae bacterium]
MFSRITPVRAASPSVRCGLGVLFGLTWLFGAASAQAQVASLDVNSALFVEPSKRSGLTVVNPSATLAVRPNDWLTVKGGYEADIVSGASESLKGGRLSNVDIVTSATNFSDTRHAMTGGFTVTRASTYLSGSYTYGTESDYRSNAFAVSAGSDFLQKNTQIELSYGRGFDSVCTTAYAASDPASSRLALDSSQGCFSADKKRATREISLNNFQLGWTQTWTPVFATQVVLSAALQHGFLGNPYRSVVIASAGDQALENHPENRARGAIGLRGKYYVRSLQTAFSGGARLYRDTWDIFGQTYEVDAERYMLPWLRLRVRARYYDQTKALFWSDDYTGGEPEDGPRGQYWSGDRELSPLSSYLVGGRVLATREGRPGQRILGLFLSFSGSLAFDLLKTNLRDFTLGGRAPDDTLAMLWSLGARGEF